MKRVDAALEVEALECGSSWQLGFSLVRCTRGRGAGHGDLHGCWFDWQEIRWDDRGVERGFIAR